MNDLYSELLRFDSNLVELFTPVTSNLVQEFENFTKLILPKDYILLMVCH